jgi:hypothetical protein
VLALVDLARLDALGRRPEAVRVESQMQQHGMVLGPHDHRCDDPRVGPERLLHHQVDRVRCEHDVVVAEAQECSTFDHPDDLVARRGIPAVLVENPHER